MIAALYAALTLVFAPISFGAVQCRVSEVLCILPLFFPDAVWGLFVGCFISNVFMGSVLDMTLGALTTLVAAFLTYKTRKNLYLAIFFPVILESFSVSRLD